MSSPRTTPAMRLDIQGLRAIAVLAVVIFHAQKHWLPGGFIGVDVFFVISGFLMTGLLRRELTSGRDNVLRDFFVKRLRRLFPAASVVITVTIIVLFFFGPILRFQEFGFDAMASLVYLANLRFSLSNTGYFANVIPTPFLHLWSLSVEEQFYIGLALLFVALRRSSNGRVLKIIAAIAAASFLTSVFTSTLLPDFAYYHLPTRTWEFMLGSLVSLTLPFWRTLHHSWAQYLRMAGFGLIVLSLIVVNESLPFPGWIALLPTLGAALIIGAGASTEPSPRHSIDRDYVRQFIESKPMTYIGDISYSLYLWHWPVLIVPYVINGEPLEPWPSILAIAISFALGIASYHGIEQPIRIHKGATFNVRTNVVVTAGIALAICAVAGSFMLAMQQRLDNITNLSSNVASGKGLQTPVGNTDFPAAKQLTPLITDPGAMTDQVHISCMQGFTSSTVKVCTYSPQKFTKKILIYGDSQANMLWPAFKVVAEKRGWQLNMIVKSACAPADLPAYPGGPAGLKETCPVWQKNSLAKIAELQPDLIILAGHPNDLLNTMGLPKAEFNQKWADALASYSKKLPAKSVKLFVTDRPVLPTDPMQCLPKNLTNPSACDHKLSSLIDTDRIAKEKAALEPLGVQFMSLNDGICPGGVCSLVQKNYITYLDGIHLTQPFARALAPFAWVPTSLALGLNP